jgi:hypothetical protein
MSAAKAKKRLRPGELDDLVLTYIADHKDDGPLTATAIGKGVGRSSGAVANCLARLAKAKKVRQAKRKPRAYALKGEVAMCRVGFRQWGRRGGRVFFPETTPPPLNHAVVTGKLLGATSRAGAVSPG